MRRVVALAVLVLLAGCAPEGGEVTNRKHDVSCIKTGAVVNCDPIWELEITDPSQRHPVYTDRPLSGWEKVSEDVYERCRVGMRWPDCKGPR
jgi:hypothetical protein